MAGRDLPFPSDEEIEAAGWVRRRDCETKIISTPRVGQYFWVDFPRDAFAPEFVGMHPGIVIRAAGKRLHDTCVVVPLTSRRQEASNHQHQLSKNPNPKGRQDGILPWAICDHLYTVHVGRLSPPTTKYGNNIYPKAEPQDMTAIFAAIRSAFPHVLSPEAATFAEPAAVPASTRPLGPNTLTLTKRATAPVEQ